MKNHYSRIFRQFRSLSKQINNLLTSGKWQSLSILMQNKLLEKLKIKYLQLKGIFAARTLVRLLGAAAFLIGIGSSSVQAQTNFKAPVVNPFGLDSLEDLNSPAFVDIDDDGDLDIFAGDYFGNLNFFENTGSASAPAFGAPDTAAFGLPEFDQFLYARFADFDGDGDFDLMGASDTGSTSAFIYVENTGSASAAAFGSIVLNPFGLSVAGSGDYLFPVTADLDGDGDFDLLAVTDAGEKLFFENTGSSTAPTFAAGVSNPFGLVNNPSGYEAPPALADVDGDGDIDLVEVEYYNGDVIFFENTGSATAPAFAAPVTNPFMLVSSGAEDFSAPAFGDLDDDGDMDLMIGDYYGAFKYYENDSPVGIEESTSTDEVKIFPNLTDGPIQIQLPSSETYQLQIVNQTGQLVDDVTISNAKTHQLNIDFPAGIYYFQFVDEAGNQFVKKVVKR